MGSAISRFYQARLVLHVLHPFFESGRPLVFAHRGGAGLAPENTCAAFDRGLALGADGLELDVRLSRDGVVVVHHDRTLERTTNLRGPLAAFEADELARADAGYRFGHQDAQPFRGLDIGIPRLDSVLSRYPETRLIIDMKEDAVTLARATLDVIRRANALSRVCLGSFGLRPIRAVRAMEPAVATSAATQEVRWALYRSWVRWPVTRVAYRGYLVPEIAGATRVVSPRFLAAAHLAGLAVHVWTVDAEDDARRLLSWGVDALITDRPDVMVPLCRSRR
jgi:glycerophosphoryl diester phosphodiesterase